MSKTKRVDLQFENETGGIDIKPVNIKPLKFKQFTKTIEIMVQIMHVLKSNDEVRELLTDLFKGQDDLKLTLDEIAKLSDEELEERKLEIDLKRAQKEKEFTPKVFAAVEILLMNLPNLTLELLATIANIPMEELEEQEIEEVGFEIVNAILYVNDIEKLVERGKQSLGIGKTAFSFLNKGEQKKPEGILQ